MLEISNRDGVTVFCLDTPPVNAMGLEELAAVTEAAKSVDTPLVLTGRGKAFSAGVDTKRLATYDADQRSRFIHGITVMALSLLEVTHPVVSAINGHALGGGLVLALAGDYRLAADNDAIKLGLTEAQAGVPFPAGALEVIRAEIEPAVLRYLTLSSSTIGVARACEAQLVDELCAPTDLLETAIARARQLSAQPAFGGVKHQIRGALIDRVRAHAKAQNDPLTLELAVPLG